MSGSTFHLSQGISLLTVRVHTRLLWPCKLLPALLCIILTSHRYPTHNEFKCSGVPVSVFGLAAFVYYTLASPLLHFSKALRKAMQADASRCTLLKLVCCCHRQVGGASGEQHSVEESYLHARIPRMDLVITAGKPSNWKSVWPPNK